MLIRHFIPAAVAVVSLLCVGAEKLGVPAAPVGIITSVAAGLLLLQLEDSKLGNLLSELVRAFKSEHHGVN